jgi:hypothetical protein
MTAGVTKTASIAAIVCPYTVYACLLSKLTMMVTVVPFGASHEEANTIGIAQPSADPFVLQCHVPMETSCKMVEGM